MRGPVAVLWLFAACGGRSASTPHDSAVTLDSPIPRDALAGDAPTDGHATDAAPSDGAIVPAAPTQTMTLTFTPVVVAISADGKTLATTDLHTIYVFTRASTTAAFSTTPAQTIALPTGKSIAGDVSLSADGGLLACGASADNMPPEALVYTRHSSTYDTTPQVVTHAAAATSLMYAASLSPDGSELAVGYTSSFAILPRTGSTFSTTPSRTIPLPAVATAQFGDGGAFSSDGNTLVIGDVGVTGGGAVFIFDGSSATPQQTLMPPADETDFGPDIALRADGHELVVGSIEVSSQAMQVDVFERSSSGFQRAQTITPPAGAAFFFGVSVALAGDGTLVVTDDGSSIYIYAP
jgi:hypothetical protein